jgi:hypothetical protein
MTKLQISRNEWWEAKRHNAALEEEQRRHNQETEALTRQANENTRLANEEQARANRAREQLTAEAQGEAARANYARELENFRHNSASEALDKLVAKQSNQREWRKLTLTQQRNETQNALDLATKSVREAEALVKTNEARANLPQAERTKMLADIQMAKSKLAQQQREFLITSQQKEKDLSLQEKKVNAEANLNTIKAARESVNLVKDSITLGGKLFLTLAK